MSNIEEQKEVIKLMITVYCNKNHKNSDTLCDECNELYTYACDRLDRCIFGEKKGSCGKCKIHCYKKDMRDKIKKVMKFSGPRMILYKPTYVIKHAIQSIRTK